ncbi:Uncharacterized protein TCM_034614 [Theobroma cacao]|uniref:Uncharacterized protein n=1 Tax=Theobroma cacao TaxID=3641 RepID=A0A061FFC5_THECC|nr:Uncharacterized protein TCM_034614 [Theobroma cacao]
MINEKTCCNILTLFMNGRMNNNDRFQYLQVNNVAWIAHSPLHFNSPFIYGIVFFTRLWKASCAIYLYYFLLIWKGRGELPK